MWFLVDVFPYYFGAEVISRLEGPDAMFYIVATNYIPIPGKYPHPCHNGYYQVVNRVDGLYLRNQTNGASSEYNHKLRMYGRAARTIKLPTTTVFYDHCLQPSLNVVDTPPIG